MKTVSEGIITGVFLLLFSIFVSVAQSQKADTAPLLQNGDTVVFTGGTNAVQEQFEGYLETLLTAGHPELDLVFRTMAWEADTVYRQQRPLNFPTWEEQLSNVESTIIIAQFGQMECLDGLANLSDFTETYGTLLDTFSPHARTIVLVSPTPFEPFPYLPAGELAARNDRAKAYSAAINRLAEERDLVFVDLFEFFAEHRGGTPLTTDGIHLSAAGRREAASAVASKLGCSVRFSKNLQPLRRAIVEKNKLWFHYWRPTNWAFLHGDRTHVPSSRDHRDLEIRWFPAEMEQYRPLIRDAEERIHSLARKTKTDD